jgi:Tfp pilus assembly major pilin PilA
MFCTSCGVGIQNESVFCSVCGEKIEIPVNNNNPDIPVQSSSISDRLTAFRSIVAEKNADYYIPKFEAFERGDRRISWNWAAFFVAFYWMLYRKMWGSAFLYFLSPYIVGFGVGFLGALWGMNESLILMGVYTIALGFQFIIAPMYANYYYYRVCNKRINAIQSLPEDMHASLYLKRGGTSGVGLILAFIFAVFMIGILAAIALPAYQTYVEKAKQAQESLFIKNSLSDAYQYALEGTEKFEEYYFKTGYIPNDFESASYTARRPVSLETVTIGDNGSIAMDVNMGNGYHYLYLVPTLVEGHSDITWECLSTNAPQSYLPKQCSYKPSE